MWFKQENRHFTKQQICRSNQQPQDGEGQLCDKLNHKASQLKVYYSTKFEEKLQNNALRYDRFEVGFTTVPSKTEEFGTPRVSRVITSREGNLKNDVSPMFFNKLLRTVAYVCFMNVRAKWKRATSPSFKPKKQGLHRSFLPPVVKMHGSSGWMPQKWRWLAPKIVFASVDPRTSLCFQNRPPQSLSQGGQGLTHEVGLLPGVIWGWLLGLGPAIFCYHYIQVSFN